MTCLAAGKPILGHFRRQISEFDQKHLLSRWSHSASQARFCSSAAYPSLSRLRQLIADGLLRPGLLGFAVRLLTDSIQFAMDVVDEKRVFVSKLCHLCDDDLELDVYHLFTCSEVTSVRNRQQLLDQLLVVLRDAGAHRSWLGVNGKLPLMAFVRNLFDARDHRFRDDNAKRLRCAFGCFSHDELSCAMATAGVANNSIWLWVDGEFRRLLLSYAFDEWARHSD